MSTTERKSTYRDRLAEAVAAATPVLRDHHGRPKQSATRVLNAVLAVRDAELEAANQRAEQAETLLRDLVDSEDCWFDHHGGCQAHGYLSLQPGEKCPQAEAKELLAALNPAGGSEEEPVD